jgi:hypothetical protein
MSLFPRELTNRDYREGYEAGKLAGWRAGIAAAATWLDQNPRRTADGLADDLCEPPESLSSEGKET